MIFRPVRHGIMNIVRKVEEYPLDVKATPAEVIFLNHAILYFLNTADMTQDQYRIAAQALHNFQKRIVDQIPSNIPGPFWEVER